MLFEHDLGEELVVSLLKLLVEDSRLAVVHELMGPVGGQGIVLEDVWSSFELCLAHENILN